MRKHRCRRTEQVRTRIRSLICKVGVLDFVTPSDVSFESLRGVAHSVAPCYIAAGPGDPKTWTLGPCRTLVANLPDLWDFIQPKLCRLALSLLYAGQKVRPGSYSEAAEYESRPERKNRRRLPPTKVFINYVAPIPSCNNRCHLRSLGCANIPLDASLNGLPMEANHRLAEPSQFEGYRRRYCRCAGSQRQNAEKHLVELVQRTAFILTCRSVSKSEVASITPLATQRCYQRGPHAILDLRSVNRQRGAYLERAGRQGLPA